MSREDPQDEEGWCPASPDDLHDWELIPTPTRGGAQLYDAQSGEPLGEATAAQEEAAIADSIRRKFLGRIVIAADGTVLERGAGDLGDAREVQVVPADDPTWRCNHCGEITDEYPFDS